MIDADNDSDNDSDDNIGDINDDNNGDINDAEDDDNNSDFYPLLAKAVIPQAGFLHKIFSLELFFFPPDDNHNDHPDDKQ